MKRFIRNNWPIWLLIAISAIVYHKWLSFDIFLNGDYGFLFSETLKDWLHYSTWESQTGLGSSNLFLWTYIFRLANGAFGFFGFDFNVADKFLIFGPFIFFTPIFSYFFVKEILKNKSGAFAGACVFSFSTYYLAINTQGHLSLPLAGTFATLVMLFFYRYFKDGKVKNLIISALCSLLITAYDFRVFYILFFILLALPFWNLLARKGMERKKIFFRQNFRPLALFFGSLFLLNLFWIWPTAMTGSLLTNEVVGRSLVPNNYFLDLGKSLTLFHPFWNGGEPDWFHNQAIPFYFWLIPIMAALAAFWARKDRDILFWFLIALAAVFASKQDARPLQGVYPWLHQYFPGFNAFREASKFYFAIALSYAVLIGYFVSSLWRRTKGYKIYKITLDPSTKLGMTVKYAATFLVAGIFLWNTKPILTGEMHKIFTPQNVPADEKLIREYALKQDPFFRALWVSDRSKFTAFSNAHPIIDAGGARRNQWADALNFDNFQGDEPGGSEKDKILFSKSFATNLLSESGIHHLIVNNEDFFKVSELVKNPAWKEVDPGIGKMRFFENKAVKPRIYLTEKSETIHRAESFRTAAFSSKNPARWDIALPELKNQEWLNFSESYHPDWRLTCGNFRWYDVFFNKKMFSSGNHYETDAGLNGFQLDPGEWQSICGGENGGNVKLSLFYLPQAYLYAGGTVSLATVLFLLLALVFWREKRDNKKDA